MKANTSHSPVPLIHGTDFTPNAAAAGMVAALLARQRGTGLRVLHALESDRLSMVPVATINAIRRSVQARLDEEVERLAATGAAVTGELLEGAPDEVLIKEAAQPGAGWIVVSSLGRRAPGSLLIGTVSGRVAQSAPGPTLVVRDEKPFARWLRDGDPLRVFCAYDFTTTGDGALEMARQLSLLGPCEVVVAHVNWPPEGKRRLGTQGEVRLDANPAEVQITLERDLHRKARAALGESGWRGLVAPSWGQPGFRLAELAIAERADLVVVGTRQRRGVERLGESSTSRSLLKYAPMSVLVVPAPHHPAQKITSAIRHVLVPVDLSEESAEAITHALALLRGGGKISVLQVTSPGQSLAGKKKLASILGKDSDAAENRARLDQWLTRHLPNESLLGGLLIEPELVASASTPEAIAQAAERLGVDAICMTSHGRSGWKAAVLGSVTQAVISISRRPVYVVPLPRR